MLVNAMCLWYNANMKRIVLVIAVVVLLLLGGTTAVLASRSQQKPATQAIATVPFDTASIFAQVNQVRTSNGIQPLTRDIRLDLSAEAKCQDEVNLHYFKHNRPNGEQPWVFFDQAGYKYTEAGENLAEGYPNVSRLMTAWKVSPEHLSNMISNKYADTGIAMCKDVDTILVVQHFGNLN